MVKNIKNLTLEKNLEDGFNIALNYIAYRPRSEAEVRVRLDKAGFGENEIERIVKKLKKYNYLNDLEFAKLWINDRMKINPRGKKVLKIELLKKGINKDIVDSAIAGIADEAEQEMIKKIISKKQKANGTNQLLIDEKIISFLLRRGFRYDTIKKTIAALTS